MHRSFSLSMVSITLAASGCLTGEQHSVERSLTSTVTLARESLVELDLPIPVVLEGTSRTNDVVITVELTVTASSSTVASRRADEIRIESETEGSVLRLRITEPPRVTIGGVYQVRLPSDLDVKVTQRGGTVDVLSIDGRIEVNSLSHVRVVDATNDVSVAVERGNALIQTEAAPGRQTLVRLNRGDVELTLPPAISADIEADVIGNGNIVVAHPRLPRYPGGTLPYRAFVAGGLSVMRLQTGTGLIVITSR